MVLFHKGKYQVGSDDGAAAEAPVRLVQLEAFLLDEALVTNADFSRFVDSSGYVTDAEVRGAAWGWQDGTFGLIESLSWRSYAGLGREDHPVVLVSWNDAKTYADWAGKRLPTEWEWEAAASALSGLRYPWGDHGADAIECNWNRLPGAPPPTAAVRYFPANPVGLYDMVGNVWQWCENRYEGNDGLRARRGGAWNVIQDFRLRCSNRGALSADAAAPNQGFRCAANFDG
jgi:formylglycine-generating enzyme required for sulfatase activity